MTLRGKTAIVKSPAKFSSISRDLQTWFDELSRHGANFPRGRIYTRTNETRARDLQVVERNLAE